MLAVKKNRGMQNADCGIRKGEKSLVFYSEIRCFSHDYKNFLKEREKHIGDLLSRIRDALATMK